MNNDRDCLLGIHLGVFQLTMDYRLGWLWKRMVTDDYQGGGSISCHISDQNFHQFHMEVSSVMEPARSSHPLYSRNFHEMSHAAMYPAGKPPDHLHFHFQHLPSPPHLLTSVGAVAALPAACDQNWWPKLAVPPRTGQFLRGCSDDPLFVDSK